jgi:rhamnose transport system permease protein
MSDIPAPAPRRLNLRLAAHEAVLLVILAAAVAVLATLTDRFFTLDNLLNQGMLMTEVGLIAMPMTFIIITGGIDLSVGSTLGMCAILLGYSWHNWGFPLPLAIAFALLCGAAGGFANGWFITRLRVPPLIMTIATLALYRGLAEGISQAHSVRGYPDWFYGLGQGNLLGVPSQLWVLLVAIIVAGVVLARTTFGRALYAIGHNETAARFSGLPVDRIKLAIYTASGFMAALAAWIFVSRVSTTRSDMGIGVELDVIAAVVLGGTSIFGGVGTIAGTVLGLVLIQLLKDGLALTGVKGDATIMVIGCVLIASTLVTSLAERRREAARLARPRMRQTTTTEGRDRP